MKRIPQYLIFICLFFIQPVLLHSAVVINVSLPDTTAKSNEVVYIPVIVDDLTGLNISAYSIVVKYDSTVLKWAAPKTSGALTAGFFTIDNPEYNIIIDEHNNYVANHGKLSGAASNSINGGGTFIYLGFTVKDNPLGTSTTIELYEVSLQSTQGDPDVSASHSAFYISDTQQKSIESGADSVSFNFTDNSKIEINFSSGILNSSTISIADYGSSIPPQYSDNQQFSSTLGYYNVKSNIENTFQAELKFFYTDELLQSANINEADITIAKYDTINSKWREFDTVKDTINNIISVTTDSFSLWAVTDKNDTLLKSEEPVPVELISFELHEISGGNIKFIWESSSGNLGFEIQQSPDNHNYETIDYIEAEGTFSLKNRYEYIYKINNYSNSDIYYYRLKLINYDGSYQYSDAVMHKNSQIKISRLHNIYPNPFNAQTVITYELYKPEYVSLKMYSISGREVMTLEEKSKAPGFYSVKWDGKNESGRTLSSGIYLCVFKAGNTYNVKKVTLLK